MTIQFIEEETYIKQCQRNFVEKINLLIHNHKSIGLYNLEHIFKSISYGLEEKAFTKMEAGKVLFNFNLSSQLFLDPC